MECSRFGLGLSLFWPRADESETTLSQLPKPPDTQEGSRLNVAMCFGDFTWIISNCLITEGTDGEGISFSLQQFQWGSQVKIPCRDRGWQGTFLDILLQSSTYLLLSTFSALYFLPCSSVVLEWLIRCLFGCSPWLRFNEAAPALQQLPAALLSVSATQTGEPWPQRCCYWILLSIKAESFFPFLTSPGHISSLYTSDLQNHVIEGWPQTSRTFWCSSTLELYSPPDGAQPVPSSCSISTEPLLPFPAQGSTLSCYSTISTSTLPRAAGGLWQEPTGSWQAQPSPSLSQSLFALEPRLVFANPCPKNIFLTEHLRAWHFPCPDDLHSAGSPPKSQLGTPLHTFCSV